MAIIKGDYTIHDFTNKEFQYYISIKTENIKVEESINEDLKEIAEYLESKYIKKENKKGLLDFLKSKIK